MSWETLDEVRRHIDRVVLKDGEKEWGRGAVEKACIFTREIDPELRFSALVQLTREVHLFSADSNTKVILSGDVEPEALSPFAHERIKK